MSQHTAGCPSSLRGNNGPWSGQTTVCSSVSGHSGCSLLQAIGDKAAVDTDVHESVRSPPHPPTQFLLCNSPRLGKCLEVELLDRVVVPLPSSRVASHPTGHAPGLPLLTSSPIPAACFCFVLGFCFMFGNSPPRGCKVVSHCSWDFFFFFNRRRQNAWPRLEPGLYIRNWNFREKVRRPC